MRKYDSYKDSGIEWIGDIPANWSIARGKEVLGFMNGYPFNSGLFSKDKNDGLPLVRIRDLKSTEFSTYYKGEAVEDVMIEDNDIIIGMDGDFNAVKWNKGKALLNQRLCKIYGVSKLDSRYLYYSLPFYLQIIHDLTYFTTVKHLSNGDLFDQKYIIPSTEEQTQISNYLDHKTSKIDDLISKKEQLIELLKEERTAIINQAVTKGLDPNAPMQDSGIEWLGEIPEHWTLKKLKYVASLISNKTSEKPNYIIALENIQGWTGNIIGDPFNNKMDGDAQLYNKGDILFNKLRPYLAKVALPSEKGGAMGELLVLRPNKFVTSEFLFHRLRSEMIITIVDGSTYGTKMPRASWDKFISLLEFGIPSLDEQKKIAEFIDSNENRISTLILKVNKEIELLKEYKTALISEVVTGKVDVRDEVIN